jgi:DNA-binding Xre family transcriptional regulator
MKRTKPRRKMRNYIEDSKWKKKDVAEYLGISEQRLTHILSGRTRTIKSGYITWMCKLLDCSPDKLLGKKDLTEYNKEK